jgi:ankyrin repeat protein
MILGTPFPSALKPTPSSQFFEGNKKPGVSPRSGKTKAGKTRAGNIKTRTIHQDSVSFRSPNSLNSPDPSLAKSPMAEDTREKPLSQISEFSLSQGVPLIPSLTVESLNAYCYNPAHQPDDRYVFDKEGKTLAHRVFETQDERLIEAFLGTGFPLYVFDSEGNLPGKLQDNPLGFIPLLTPFKKAYDAKLNAPEGSGFGETEKLALKNQMLLWVNRIHSSAQHYGQKSYLPSTLLEMTLSLFKDLKQNSSPQKTEVSSLESSDLLTKASLLQTTEILLQLGANPNGLAPQRPVPLIEAVQLGNLKLVNLLLKYGANPNQCHLKQEMFSNKPYQKSEIIKHWKAVSPLSAAAQNPDSKNIFSIIQTLLAHGANLNQGEGAASDIFSLALKNNHSALLGLCLDPKNNQTVIHGVLNPTEKDGPTTALGVAIQHHRMDLVDLLLNIGVSPNGPMNKSQNYLHWAVLNQNEGLVKKLLKAGADPNLYPLNHEEEQYGETVKNYFSTPLLIAVAKENESLVDTLIKAGASPNHRYPFESKHHSYAQLPLYEAIYHKRPMSLIHKLLAAGANPSLVDSNFLKLPEKYYHHTVNSISLALIQNNFEAFSLCLEAMKPLGLKKYKAYNAPAFIFHSEPRQMKQVMNLYLDQGAPLNHQDPESVSMTLGFRILFNEWKGNTVLIHPFSVEQMDVLKTLLGYGMKLPVVDETQDKNFEPFKQWLRSLVETDPILHKAQTLNPIQAAVWMGNVKRVKALHEDGDSLTDLTPQGESMVQLALYREKIDVLDYLLSQGAAREKTDLSKTDLSKMDLSMILEKPKALELIQVLAKHHVDLNHPGALGRTLLHLAAKSGNYLLVKALVEAGATPDIKDDMGKTPLMLAQQFERADILNCLKLAVGASK